MSLRLQLADLALLKDGWKDGEGHAFTVEHLERVRFVVESLIELYSFTMPFLYPTVGGAVRAEWPGDHWEVVVWIQTGLELVATEVNGAGYVEDMFSASMAGIALCAMKMAELLKEPS